MGQWTSFELRILDSIQNISMPLLDRAMVDITSLGNFSILWIAFIVIFLSTKEYKKAGKVIVIAFILNLIIVNILLKNIFDRSRPFQVVGNFDLLIPPLNDGSFPSGHSSYAFTFFAIILFITKSKSLKIFTGVLAFLIAFSRLYLYVHFPTDVIVGSLIGFLLGVLAIKIYDSKNVRKILPDRYLQIWPAML